MANVYQAIRLPADTKNSSDFTPNMTESRASTPSLSTLNGHMDSVPDTQPVPVRVLWCYLFSMTLSTFIPTSLSWKRKLASLSR
jgi:hypothetical protein